MIQEQNRKDPRGRTRSAPSFVHGERKFTTEIMEKWERATGAEGNSMPERRGNPDKISRRRQRRKSSHKKCGRGAKGASERIEQFNNTVTRNSVDMQREPQGGKSASPLHAS